MPLRLSARPLLLACLAAAAALGLGGCEPTLPEVPEGTFEATWAGAPWYGEAGATFPASSDTLYLFGTSPVGAGAMMTSYVAIRAAFTGPGTYALAPGAAEFRHLVGGDVVVATYTTTGSAGGTLVIEERTATRIRGFVDFEAESLGEYSPDGPRARFTGTFDAGIYAPR